MGNWIFTEVEITSVKFDGLSIVQKMKEQINTEYPIEIVENTGLYVKVCYRTKNEVPVDIFFDLSEQYEDTIIRITFSETLLDLAGVFEFRNGKGLGVWGRPERNDPDNPYSLTNQFRDTQFNFQQVELNKTK